MTEEYTIDCPAIPITHASVEFQNMKIRDRYVRSANMRKIELDGRRIKISPVLEAEERFDRKRLGFIKCIDSQNQRNCTALDTNELREEKHHHRRSTHCENRCHWKAQIQQIRRCRRRSSNSHEEVAVKKLVTTTVSSREKGIERRNETMTTSSHHGETTKNKKKTNRIHFSFNSKNSKKVFFSGSEEDTKSKDTHNAATCDENKRKRGREKAEAVQDKATDTSKADVEGSSGSNDSPSIQEEMRQDTTVFIVLQKNMRSMNSSERLDELFREVHHVRWDVILISKTWRQSKEVWETQQGHIVVESGMFTNKHGVDGRIRSTGSTTRLNEWLQHRFRSTNNR